MKNKTLVISGGTRGIGKSIVEKFASCGANIAFTYISNAELAKKQCEELEKKISNKSKSL